MTSPSNSADEDALLCTLLNPQHTPSSTDHCSEDYWHQWDIVTEGRARRVTLDNVDAVIVDYLREPDPFDFLERAFIRSHVECPELAQILLRYTTLMITRPELLPVYDSRQLSSAAFCDWLCADNRSTNRSVKALLRPDGDDEPMAPDDVFLVSLMISMSDEEIRQAVNIIVITLVKSIRKENLSSPTYQDQLRGLHRLLLSSRRCLQVFSILPNFIVSWINGPNFEFDSIMGVFLRLSTLTERDFSVADTVFAQAEGMSDQHILVSTTNLRHKLDRVHAEVFTIWREMILEAGICRSALLAWIACVLLSNWGRSRLRSRNRATSTNEFIMSICILMTKIATSSLRINVDSIKADFFMTRSRLDLGDNETRIHATLSEVQGLPDDRNVIPQSDADQAFLRAVLTDSHFGIICDSCRTRCIQGVRFKCLHCNDFDLCETCELEMHLRSLGKGTRSLITYDCPFRACHANPATCNLVENDLRQHIANCHQEDHHQMRCPICTVSGGDALFSNIHDHVRRDHADNHDHLGHVMVKIRFVIPCSPWKRSLQMTLPELVHHEPVDQAVVFHEGIACKSCNISPIQGIRFVCISCPATFDWCSDCEAQEHIRQSHPANHLFLQLRQPVRPGEWMNSLPAIPLYPNAVNGSYGINLQSEWFFFTMHALHLGVIQTCAKFSSLVQALQGTNRANPQHSSMLKMKLTLAVQLLDPNMLKNALAFYGLTARFLLKLIGFPSFPLPEPCPTPFAVMPEYFLEDMAAFCVFLCENHCAALDMALPAANSPKITEEHHCAYILRLFVCLIASPEYVRNPHLRFKFVELLCGLAPFPTSHGPGTQRFSALISTDVFMIENLLPTLIRHYVLAEHSGSTSQFFDKFNIRNLLELVINWVLLSDVHRDVLHHFCKTHSDDALQFIHCLLSDLVFVMDEVIMKSDQLGDIARSTTDPRNSVPIRRHLRIVATLSNEALRTLSNLASFQGVQEILMRPEIAERIAQTISYYVFKLVEIIPLAERESLATLGIVPGNWLTAFCQLYICLSPFEQFNLAVVSDERSFRPDLIPKCLHLLRQSDAQVENSELFSPDFLIELEKYFDSLILLSEQQKSKNYELGDIPEEFLDPILNTLMENPVILPSSGVTMDMAVICRHLLSSKSDPFCREPLTPEMLHPNTELRERIDKWKRARKR